MKKGFSLLEAMVCVVIVGIAAAIALPSVLPLRSRQNLQGSCDILAGFLARARLEAMVQKRCTRVRVAADVVVVEGLASFDCDQQPLRGPFLPPATGSPWVEIARSRKNSDEVFAVDAAPPVGPGGEPGEIRFRPTGRLFTQSEAPVSAVVSVVAPGAGRLAVRHGARL